MKIITPNKIPTDIQEKLALAISNYDSKAIEKLLQAGANPFTLHKTEIAGSFLRENRIEVIAGTEELAPYYILFYTPVYATLENEAVRRDVILKTAETLLKNGVSVDKKPSNISHGFGDTFTFREQVAHWLKEFEDTAKNQSRTLTPEQKDYLENQIVIIRSLLAIIRKYQSEPAS